MAITSIFGFDHCAVRTDGEIPYIEGLPFSWDGNSSYLYTINDEVLNRVVLRMRSSNSNAYGGSLLGKASDVFKGHHTQRSKWYIGYRFRYEIAVSNRALGDGGGIEFSLLETPTQQELGGYTSEELAYYIIEDRYTYHELCLDWETGKLRRWVDGYELEAKDIPQSLIDAEDFNIRLGTWSPTPTVYSRWTDFYFLVDTKDATECKRLGGALVKPLAIGLTDITEKWERSDDTKGWNEILNTQLSDNLDSRINPYLLTSNAENASTFFMTKPTLGKGAIKFVQLKLNAYRKNGADPTLHAAAVMSGLNTDQRDYDLLVDGYEGRQVAELNKALDGSDWTPELVETLGVKVHSTSGGGGS